MSDIGRTDRGARARSRDAAQTIDATGGSCYPRHRQPRPSVAAERPGIVMADDFESGTRAAAFGGNTTVLPFCLQERDTACVRRADYHTKADGNCYTDISFHLIISDPTEQVLGQ